MNDDNDSYLKRLPPEYYRGQAYVHWSLTIQDRKQGWLKPVTLYRFRELLTHTMFRYGLCDDGAIHGRQRLADRIECPLTGLRKLRSQFGGDFFQRLGIENAND